MSDTEYDDIEPSKRHLSASDLDGDVVSNGGGAHYHSCNEYWGEDWGWQVTKKSFFEAQTDDRDDSSDTQHWRSEAGPPDARPTVEQNTQRHGSQHHKQLEEGELRLVKIVPGLPDELVQCETQIVPVSAHGKYIAMSYAWGLPIAEHAIILDGKMHMLPKTLWHFLRAWRSRMIPKRYYRTRQQAIEARQDARQRQEVCPEWLWVDALCIDQLDLQERMHQVRIMSRIFAGADEVLVWLGLANEAVESFMVSSRGRYRYALHANKGRILEYMVGLEDLCERSYWSRLWIFQELRCAKAIVIMCGSETAPWQEFEEKLSEAVDISSEDSIDPQRRQRKPAGLEQSNHLKFSAAQRMVLLCSSGAPTSLWLLLQVTSHLDCYDPRDRIYALLSLVKTGSEDIDADYNSTLPKLMHRVLSNSYAADQPQNVHDVAVRCARLKAMMGLGRDFPWGADEYLAAKKEVGR